MSVDIYPPSQPSGMTLAYTEVTANQTGITTEVDITNLTVTVTVPAGRRIKITGYIPAFSTTVTGDAGRISIKEGATLLTLGQAFIGGTAAGANSIMPQVILTPPAGTHTYKLTASRVSGSGTFVMNADPTFPAYILVEDITGTIYPAGTLVTAGIIASEAWTVWTPTLTNLTLGNGTMQSAYQKFGRTIHYRFEFTLGTTSSVGTAPQFTLPVAPLSTAFAGQDAVIGRSSLRDQGVVTHDGVVIWNGTAAVFRALNILNTYLAQAGVSATVPFTWGTNDALFSYGTYEATT